MSKSTIYLCLTLLGAGAGALSAVADWRVLLGGAAVNLVAVHVVSARSTESRIPAYYYVFLGTFTFSFVIPAALNLPLQMAVLAEASIAWVAVSASERRVRAVAGWCLAIVVDWFVLVGRPNVKKIYRRKPRTVGGSLVCRLSLECVLGC